MITRPWNTATNHLRYKSEEKHLREVAQVRERSVDPAVETFILYRARETSIYFGTGGVDSNGRYQDQELCRVWVWKTIEA